MIPWPLKSLLAMLATLALLAVSDCATALYGGAMIEVETPDRIYQLDRDGLQVIDRWHTERCTTPECLACVRGAVHDTR